MNKEQAEALCGKWIEEERMYRNLAVIHSEGSSLESLRCRARANTLQGCRRELQVAAGLVLADGQR